MTVSDRPKVLIVDDRPENLLAMEFALSGLDAELIKADGGSEALALTLQHDFALVLLDVQMPGMDGYEVATLLRGREATASIPIIFVTAIDKDHMQEVRGYEAGAVDYVFKPVNPEILESKIKVFLELYRSRRTLKAKNKRLGELYETAHKFVDNVSHEFRTPLTAIKEFASIIRDGLAGEINDEQKEYLDIVNNRVDDLTIMVNDMLDISKLEAGMLGLTRRDCHVAEIIDHLGSTLENKAAISKVAIDFDVPEDLPLVFCDQEKIGRIIINLVVNAIKFSNDDGLVNIRAREDVGADQVIVSVTDNGPGIGPENLEKIFERFKQVGSNARASTKGFGLGLNIASELVHLNFGDMTVASESGEGSTFSFTIPTSNRFALLQRYLDRMSELRNGSSFVSLLVAEGDIASETESLDRLGIFLEQQLRRPDLILRSGSSRWLILAAVEREDVGTLMDRVHKARADLDREGLFASLPAMEIHAKGTWRAAGDRDEIMSCFEVECALETEAV